MWGCNCSTAICCIAWHAAGVCFPAAHAQLHPGFDHQSTMASTPPNQLPQPASITAALQLLLAGAPHSDVCLPWGGPTCPACSTNALASSPACLTPRACLLVRLYSDLGAAGRQCAGSLLSAGARGSATVAAELRGVVAGASARLVEAVVAAGWGVEDLQNLKPAVALPLLEALQRCRANPPDGGCVAVEAVYIARPYL